MQEACRKREYIITRHLRHFAFLRVFFGSEGEFKNPATNEIELFLTLANG